MHLSLLAPLIVTFAFTHTNNTSAELLVGTPFNLGPVVNSATRTDTDPEISADGLTLYFMRGGPPDFGTLMSSHRDSLTSPWKTPVSIPILAAGVRPGESPTVTADDLSMYFHVSPTGNSDTEIYQSTRSSASAPWGQPINIGPLVNSPYRDRHPSISPDGLTLYFVSNRDNPSQSQLDIYVAQRHSQTDPFGDPVRLGSQVNTTFNEGGVEVSANGLLLFFHSDRDAPSTGQDIFYSQRSSIDEPWGAAQKLGPTVNSANMAEGLPSISGDGKYLYYGVTSGSDFNTSDLYVVEIVPEPPAITILLVGGGLCFCMVIGRHKAHARN
jgi:OOP family OmpA-OmpF porin